MGGCSISRTTRLLVVFHLFQHCREVSFKEITDMLPVSLAFTRPEEPESRTQKRRLEKLRRLCTLMVRLEEAEDPVAWYRETCPELSERTRQRDWLVRHVPAST